MKAEHVEEARRIIDGLSRIANLRGGVKSVRVYIAGTSGLYEDFQAGDVVEDVRKSYGRYLDRREAELRRRAAQINLGLGS